MPVKSGVRCGAPQGAGSASSWACSAYSADSADSADSATQRFAEPAVPGAATGRTPPDAGPS
ncbi:hypothetical protein EBF04_21660 [Streptomyces sp. I6]|nr:hypothetical protein EBF04_21660 [Streptomyces sp. I6]